MKVIAVNPANPREDRLAEALTVLRDGGVVALPTETFYGLAADALNGRAVARVNRLKRKPADSPVLLLLAEAEQVEAVCDDVPELFRALAERFWPGPLSLVVPAARKVPREVTGGRGTVAVRVPGLGLPRRLAAGLGRPISGVSANLVGEPPCRSAAEVSRSFSDEADLLLDGGATPGGAPSTVVDLTTGTPRIVREGLLPVSALRSVLPAFV